MARKKVKKPPWWKYTNFKNGTEMVLIPGGWFWMGSEDGDEDTYDSEKPRHLHYLEHYYLGIYCVTVGQFRRFVEKAKHDAGSSWKDDPDDHPVRFVNWHDASSYAEWAELQLPTEAEWELGARGYESLKYPWGDDWEEAAVGFAGMGKRDRKVTPFRCMTTRNG
jgi:formylglycine-generating enzyme